MGPLQRRAAAQVAEQVLRPTTPAVQDRLREMGYRHLEDQLGLWLRWIRGHINGEAIHALFEDGLLPAPEAPARFGFFGWEAGTRLVQSE